MQKPYYYQSQANYEKALARLEKTIGSGRFASYTQRKKQQIWNRLCRYARQLGVKVKRAVVAACIAAGLSIANPASGQTFNLQTGTADPFDGVDVGTSAVPTFVDIDADGDMDAFVGLNNGTVLFYENTGSATSPIFTARTGSANPLNGVDVGIYSTPSFVDIDGDGDLDAFIGEAYGSISYYKNTGTATNPVLTQQTGSNNPFDGINASFLPFPAFVDIDGDGDMDVFIGSYYGNISYYKNTGTATVPAFTAQTGVNNPFTGLVPGYYATPSFVDVDNDGDQDAFVGVGYGTISYYENTGSSAVPTFVSRTGTDNPLDGVDVGDFSAPAFVDIDGDGDMDVFIGADDGTITYYQNVGVLPLHLLSFSGSRQAGYNQLEWLTADEFNTKLFEVERSIDGRSFIRISSVNAAGNSSNTYSVKDNGSNYGKIFYRLKMIDIDGRFTYSPVIWVNSDLAGGLVIYPNPAKNIVNINIGNANLLKTHAGIFDTNGRLIQDILISNHQVQVDIQPLVRGMYLIKFADGSTKNFLKE